VDVVAGGSSQNSSSSQGGEGGGEGAGAGGAEPRIVGGTAVTTGEYGFFVQGNGCGGSLVAPDVVLTAAHCESAFGGGSVVVGNYLWGEVTDGAERLAIVSDLVVHPDFSGTSWFSTLENDVMLFKIERSSLPPIALNSDSTVPADGQDLTVIGFGAQVQGGSISDQLQKTTLQALDFEFCSTQTNLAGYRMDENSMLCAWVQDASTDSCQGAPDRWLALLVARRFFGAPRSLGLFRRSA
jgi:secreted trypsin-like serine protease